MVTVMRICCWMFLVGCMVLSGTVTSMYSPYMQPKPDERHTPTTSVRGISPLEWGDSVWVEETAPDEYTVDVPLAHPIDAEDFKLAKRIVTWKQKMDHGLWWECGVKYSKEMQFNVALDWAVAINDAREKVTYKYRGKQRKMDMEEVIGILIKESRFDRCAVGPNPRLFALEKGLLKDRPGTISHSLEEWERVFTHRRFRGRTADLGPGQLVKKIGGRKGLSWDEAKEYMTLCPGVELFFEDMALRGRMFRTANPSNHWPGNVPDFRYTMNARRYARALLQ